MLELYKMVTVKYATAASIDIKFVCLLPIGTHARGNK